MSRSGKQIHFWADSTLAEALQSLVEEHHQTLKEVIETLLREALAARADSQQRHLMPVWQEVMQQTQQQQLVAIQQVIREAMGKTEEIAYYRHQHSMTLLLKALHEAGMSWRLSYLILSRFADEATLQLSFTEAEEKIAAMLTHLESEPRAGT